MAHPAPTSQAIAYPAASVSLQPILESIAGLSRRDQAALVQAFRAAEQVAKPKRLTGGNTYRGHTDFSPAFFAAQMRAIEAHGKNWWANPDLTLLATVPAAWVACKLSNGRVSRSPRDVHFPRAQFWPGGILPTGPEYAEYYKIDPSGDVRITGPAREAQRAKARAEWVALMADAPPARDFALDHTPEDIDAREMESV